MVRSWLGLALALHVVLATGYAWWTPDFEGPDENSHYEYAQHVANTRGLPLAPALAQARGLPQTEGAVLAHHPPLYYALLAGVLLAVGRDDTVFGPIANPAFGQPASPARHLHFVHGANVHPLLFALRLVSVALGALSLVLVHRLGRACCPDTPRVADLAALLVACLPMWSFLHGVLNSDVLAITLATATLLVLVRALQAERLAWRTALAVGALLGAALLTKLTTLFLAPLALAALVPIARRERAAGRGRALLVRAGAGAALAAALVAPVLWRNVGLYGDALALSVHDAAFAPIPPELRWHWFVDGFVPQVLRSLFGTFGWFSLPPPAALPWLGAAVAVVAAIGLVRARVRARWLLLLAAVLVFAGTARFNWSAPQPQGRLLLTAAAPAAVLLAAGLLRVAPRWRARRWLAALLPLTAALVLVAWFRPAFAPALAPAPAWQRALVGAIVAPPAPATIEWTSPPPGPTVSPPTLRWTDPGAPPAARYTLYATDPRGRVWLATHEWSHGAMVVQDGELTVPDAAWHMLPRGVELTFRLRRVPATATDDPAALPVSAPLPFRRD